MCLRSPRSDCCNNGIFNYIQVLMILIQLTILEIFYIYVNQIAPVATRGEAGRDTYNSRSPMARLSLSLHDFLIISRYGPPGSLSQIQLKCSRIEFSRVELSRIESTTEREKGKTGRTRPNLKRVRGKRIKNDPILRTPLYSINTIRQKLYYNRALNR
jgi:hypothetical protein